MVPAMEKVVYCLTLTSGDPVETDAWDHLRVEVTEAMLGAGARGLRIDVVDSAVAPAAPMRILSSPSPADGVVSVWVDSANDPLRARLDEAIAAGPWSAAAYLVTESAPIPEHTGVADTGSQRWRRADGFTQVAFLRRPDDLVREEWLQLWLGEHTQVAIDTQSTFMYLQNVVTRVLHDASTPWDAIVEESFPIDAMTDPHVFFAADGDDDLLASNQSAMFDSVQRFIDLTTIEVIETSRYVWA
jgi:hypothetical protein